MNKEKLMANWDDLKDEIKVKILELVDKEIKEDYFVPETGEVYYYYDFFYDIGEISFDKQTYHDGKFDKYYLKTGNVFRTPEEAEFAGKCDYYTKRFETYVNRHTDKLDWHNKKQPKYYVYNVCACDCILFNDVYESNIQGTTFASSKQILKDAVTSIGQENFLKYVLKIKE